MSAIDKIEVFTKRRRENTSLKPQIQRWLKNNQLTKYEWNKNWGSGVGRLGRPDIEIIARGRTFYFELKDPKGNLSAAQKRVIKRYAELGKTVHVVSSLEQFQYVWEEIVQKSI